jgi:F0F1-type ATP synthase membrane subunit b/b'
MSARLSAFMVGLAFLVPAGAAAQGLGDTAAREREKRAKQAAAKKKEPARVFTNSDLGEGESGDTQASGKQGKGSSTAPRSPETSQEASGTNEESREEARESERRPSDQAHQARVTEAQSRVSGLEGRIKELGDKLNPMSGSFIYGATGSNSPQDEAQVRADLTQAESELVQARQELAAAQQALEDFRRRSPALR